MKQIVYLLILMAILSSCKSTYYYSILDSTSKDTEKVDNGDFLIENDSLWIAYCFKGESAPINITIFNKTDRPLYLDWNRSALIINNLAVSYAGKNINFGGRNDNTTYGSGYSYGNNDQFYSSYSNTQGNFSGNAELPRNISFIPPKTMISEKTLNIQIGLDDLDKNIYKEQIMANKNSDTYRIKRANFSENDTPLRFKSYLTIFSNPDRPMIFEQEFYISNVIKTNGINPTSLPANLNDRGDWFYIEKPANNGFVNVLLGSTIIAGAAILGTTLDSDDY